MHMRSPTDAQILRRAAVGPHALMQRGAVAPYVPDRGGRGFGAITWGSGSGAVASGVATYVGAGAVAGPIGMAVGALVGVALGAFNRQDQEVQNFDQASAIYHAQGVNGVYSIANKYLVLAGLFDLSSSQIKGNIPIYKKYGRMGEGKFVTDMVNVIYNAAQSGQITTNDTPQTVFNRIVQPWINSFGFGAMADSNGEMINAILVGMIAEYIGGAQTRWYSRGGDYGFTNLPPFGLPGAVQPTSSTSPSPQFNQPALTPQDPVSAQLQAFQAGTVPVAGTTLYVTKGTNGQFMKVPTGATFSGIDPVTGGWVVNYATGQYILDGGSLHTYAPMQQAALPSPASGAASMPVDTSTQTMPGQTSYYVPSGGGGYYPVPASQTSLVTAPAQASLLGGVSNQVLLAIGALFALSLLLPRNVTAVRSAGVKS